MKLVITNGDVLMAYCAVILGLLLARELILVRIKMLEDEEEEKNGIR